MTDEQFGAEVGASEARLWKGVAKLAGKRRPIVTGFSQGGILSFAMAARHPNEVRYAFPVAGSCPGPILPGLRQHSQDILCPDVPDMSGRGVAVNDDQIRGLVPVGRRGTVEDIASAVCYLASDEAGYITGHAMVVDGGWRAK